MTDHPLPLERSDVERLMPHAGDMCLIDRVETWDETRLQARCWSHRQADHPLARDGRLSIWHALEYGAQAMAIHGGLLAARQGQQLGQGLLAGARDLVFTRATLSDLAGDLEIEVTQQFAQMGSLIYDFRIETQGHCLATGTATVVGRP